MDMCKNYIKKIIEFFNKNKIDILCVGAIFIIALILRIIAINNYGALTQDEPYSWRFASYGSIFEVIKQIIVTDVHMPLYFIYLHIWINIFGDSYDSLHYSSLFLFLPIIPLVFCIMKECFNKTSAYISIMLLTFNTYCIYYSIYARFYIALILFGILYVYFFIKFCENFKKKHIIGFIITHLILFYMYNLTIVLTFSLGLVGLIYILKYKKENLKKFINIFLIVGLVSLPGIILTFYNIHMVSQALCRHQEEFFFFSHMAIYDVLENFLSHENYQLIVKNPGAYRDFFFLLGNAPYFFCIGVPIFMSLFVLIKGLFSKNSRLYLLLIPSLLTLLIVFSAAALDIIYYQTKYLTIIFPMIICALAYSFTCFKKKTIGIIIFIIYFLFNTCYTFTSHNSILNYKNNDLRYFTSALYLNDVKTTDLFICPFVPEVVKYFYKDSVTLIPFAFDEGLLIKDRKSLGFYFGEELLKSIKSDNLVETILPYFMDDTPMPAFEKNLYEQYISKMKKGQKLVIFNAYEPSTGNCEISPKHIFDLTYDNYKNKSKFNLAMAKVIRDCILVSEKYLKPVNVLRNRLDGCSMYIYVKE